MKSKPFQIVLVLFLVVFLSVCVVEIIDLVWLTPAEQLTLIIEGMQSTLVEERVVHPDQLDLEDVQVGDISILIHMDGSQQKVLILKSPYFEDDICRFDVIRWEDGAPTGTFICSKSCADAGLIGYSVRGLTGWNPTNHIIRSEEPSLTPEQLEEVISNLKQEPLQPELREENA